MNNAELEILLNNLESDRIECKSSASEDAKDQIRQAICAFANDLPNHRQPGVLFVGVNNDGNCANLPITDELLRTLANMRSDGNILPFPILTVQKKFLNGCELAVIIVEPADAPPVRYRGRVWVRVGTRRAIATMEEERRLSEKRRARDLPFDIWPVPSANLEDLDTDLFRRVYLPSTLPIEVLEQNQRPIEQQLTSMRFATVEPQTKPTILGTLVIGKDPREFVPGAYIQFLRLDGTVLTDPIKDQKELDGPLLDMLRILDETLQTHISVATDIMAQPVEIRHPDYPIVALQQLARNAILHRTYEGTNAPVRITWFNDRIEIQNPGGPFGQVNRQNFGQPGITDYRNPHLAEAMKNLNYVQRFGVGILLARRELEKNGNLPLEFVVEDAHILVIIRGRL
ncbi:MAG: putative DNA binding domain-containing protein [Chloroflexi bacterium]|nr:putative DNA binding domain-containing protein [Chloroflexota bacterium]